MFYLVLQSKRHKCIVLELQFEDLIIHNTVKIKQKTVYCREVRHNYMYGFYGTFQKNYLHQWI